MLWFFFLQSQYTAKEFEESRKGTEADEQTVSFSEVRRKLSGKAGKRGVKSGLKARFQVDTEEKSFRSSP